MKNPTLYIHIGTYKTGTSTIQKAIRNNSKLRKEKISDIGRPTYFRDICTTEKIEEKFITKSQKEISKRIKRERFFGRNKFIISAEDFSGNPNNGFKNSKVVAEILKKITAPLDVNVKIIAYLRRQDDFVQSMYTQEIHQGRAMMFDQYITKFDENSFNWNRLLENYAAFFGVSNIIVKRYGKIYMPDHNSVVRIFGEIIESETLKNYTKPTTANRGYSRDALEIARRCNPFLEPEEKKKLRKLLQSVSSKQPFEKYDYFNLKEKLEFLGRYEESNKKVARKYFNETHLFELPTMPYKADFYKSLNNEIIIEHFVKIIKELSSTENNENVKGSTNKKDQLYNKFFSDFPSLKENLKILLGKYY